VELLAAVADRYRKQVQGLIDTCTDTESKAKTEISKVTSQAAEIKRSFENVKAEIESYAENLRSAIDLAVVAVLRDAKQSHGVHVSIYNASVANCILIVYCRCRFLKEI